MKINRISEKLQCQAFEKESDSIQESETAKLDINSKSENNVDKEKDTNENQYFELLAHMKKSQNSEISNSDERSPASSVSEYMNSHNYGNKETTAYSQDEELRAFMRKEFRDNELPPANNDFQNKRSDLEKETAMEKLSEFIFKHNYGSDDFEKYCQNPRWRKLYSDVYPSYGMPELTDQNALDVSKINMNNYDLGDEYQDNCQRCVPAYVAQQKGYDVQAKPVLSDDDYLKKHPYDVYDDPYVITNSSQQEIMDKMKVWGDGAIAQIVLGWKSSGGIIGHTFAAKQISGETHFFDPQNGDTDVSYYFDEAEPGSISFCRADNQTFTSRINDCVDNREVKS